MTLNLIGHKYGELTVLAKNGRTYVPTSKIYRTLWSCLCLCGKTVDKTTNTLRSTKVESCGKCEWHILERDAYVSWMGMKQRCNYVGCKDYPEYGGRGITYEVRWEKFTEFFKDMGTPPIDKYLLERFSLDRKDNNGNYTKDNCKWSDRSQQQLNKSRQIRF